MSVWPLRGGILLVLLLVGWLGGSALRGGQKTGWPPRASGKVRVLTTIFPLYDFAREVGGPYVELRNLLPPGADPHEFALSPRDVSLTAESDVILANGGGLEDFLTEALEKAQVTEKPVVYVTEGLPRLESGHEPGEEAGHDHSHEGGDPHLWLDPQYARHYVRKIADALAEEMERRGDRQAVEEIRQRAVRYDTELVRLDADYHRALAPLADRAFIAFHSAFTYLVARYHLTLAGVWQTTPGREPSPREVAALLERAHAENVRALFSEPQFSPRALEMIAADAHLPVYALDPLETALDFDRTRYLDVMRANLATLVRALGPGP